MQTLLVSMMRFSAALTLFGVEQLQSAMNVVNGGEDVSKVVDRFQSALDSMSDSLAEDIGHDKKETLRSMVGMSEEVVQRTFDGINIVDPRQVLQATNDLVRKTTDTVSDWIGAPGDEGIDDDEPKRAADVFGDW